MPSKLHVKVKSVETTTRGQFNGFEIIGYDATNEKAYKNFVFEKTQKGELTKVAEVVQTLGNGDWIELTVDDSKYKNITFCQRSNEPAGFQEPTNTGSPSNGGGGGRSSGGGAKPGSMSKEEWAAKDQKKATDVARSVAVKTAATLFVGEKLVKKTVETLEKLALRMEAFLLTGDFDGDVSTVAAIADTPKAEEADDSTPPAPEAGDPGQDDDIPF